MKAKPPDRKGKVIYTRVTDAEHKQFTAAAYSSGQRVSAWIRAVLLQKIGREQGV